MLGDSVDGHEGIQGEEQSENRQSHEPLLRGTMNDEL